MTARDPRDRYYPQQVARIHERARQARLGGEEWALFRFIVDRMWMDDGPIPDDPRLFAVELRFPMQRVRKLLRALADKGLIAYGDGFIADAATNDSIIAHRAHRSTLSANGRKGVDVRERNRALQREKSASRETLTFAQKDVTFSAKSSGFSDRSEKKQALSRSPASSPASSNRKIESYPETVELASAREEAGEGEAFAAAARDLKAQWQARRAGHGGGEAQQRPLMLGPVVVAKNDAIGRDEERAGELGEQTQTKVDDGDRRRA